MGVEQTFPRKCFIIFGFCFTLKFAVLRFTKLNLSFECSLRDNFDYFLITAHEHAYDVNLCSLI